MAGAGEIREAWVLASADALNRHESWTGRIHIHKHLFIAQVLGLTNPPFDFVLYDYGPYSFELDECIAEAELFGLLSKIYPKAGYGPRYEPTMQGLEIAEKLDAAYREAIDRVAANLGNRNSQDLELIATCLWMMNQPERLSSEEEIVPAVKRAKPKYDERTITKSLADARTLAKALRA